MIHQDEIWRRATALGDTRVQRETIAYPNRALFESVIRLLSPMLEDLVSIGGCTTGLLVTDSAAGGIRSTRDVDAIVDVTSYADFTPPAVLGVPDVPHALFGAHLFVKAPEQPRSPTRVAIDLRERHVFAQPVTLIVFE